MLENKRKTKEGHKQAAGSDRKAKQKGRKRTPSLKKRKESTMSHYLEQLLERSGWEVDPVFTKET